MLFSGSLIGARKLLPLVTALLWFLVPIIGQEQLEEKQTWQQFLEWYAQAPLNVNDLRQDCIDWTAKKAGLTLEQAAKRCELGQDLAERPDNRREFQRIFWNRRYRDPKPNFNTDPNNFLVEAVHGVAPGRALDIHMGQGRNTVFLATKGWDVTGFDISEEGIRTAQALANQRGVRIKAIVQSHEDFEFSTDQWDLIVMIYTMIPIQDYAERIMKSLKPGGLLVIEKYAAEKNQLLHLFDALYTLRYEDTVGSSDWGGENTHVVRLLARKQKR